jgi:hypothetical protein
VGEVIEPVPRGGIQTTEPFRLQLPSNAKLQLFAAELRRRTIPKMPAPQGLQLGIRRFTECSDLPCQIPLLTIVLWFIKVGLGDCF